MQFVSRRPIRAAAAVLGLAFLAAAPARAQAPLDLVAPGRLTYGVAATFAPFEFSKDGQLTGFDIEFGAAIAAKLNLAPAPLNIEFRGLIPALQGRRVDIINSAMYINAARSEQVDFVPYMRIGQQMVVRRGNPRGIKGRDDLCGRSVAVTLGGIQETYARQDAEKCQAAGRPALTVMTFPTAQDSALSVRQGRADAYYESTAGVARIVLELSDAFEATGEIFEFGTQIGLAVRKGDTATAEALRGAVQAVAADGTYRRLMAKYNLPPEGSLF
ncbi:ABC transporter substrate-binding protein [Roseomonas indoligenes]|uniref:ABC transporter substrate-binding protein n=1 Tax=Roseomonas indoligenes TaxID=2820811 RepID=A0A940N1P8_9PROT|nr:ABC transporter substrate-binding protein [Pararoseomonas indoligenes]MBP0496341.1 ABC transporter substrate-binding protein [Pararoseomonas indoligenes]